MKIVRIEKGLGVALPEDTVRALDLHEGDEVQLAITRAPKPLSPEQRAAALAGLDRFFGLAPAGFKFDRDEANER